MKYKIVIPDDFFSVFKFNQEGKIGVAAINTALRGFEDKIVFGWHLSIMLHFDNARETGMPIENDHKKVEEFEDQLRKIFNPSTEKPNAIFLGRITWNKTAELIWRVHNAKDANNIIQAILTKQLVNGLYFVVLKDRANNRILATDKLVVK